jgi:lactate dehydrogenase-like 2-hydroxyacid dehydrogenase
MKAANRFVHIGASSRVPKPRLLSRSAAAQTAATIPLHGDKGPDDAPSWEGVLSSETREKTVGFVGLGMMGGPMAANILKAGHPLVAYDIDREKNASIAALGAQMGSGPADVASRAQKVV